ncbi:MAG TPA: hypothetical protein VFF53_05145 [Geobacteraceae bacterium]|jgi:hypothetical protein|nr:hypothetical protein [Geobacteraceae bacterium]
MNSKQIIILIGACVVSALIVWHDLPIEFPGIIGKVLMLFLKLSVILALTIFGYMFAAGKKSS